MLMVDRVVAVNGMLLSSFQVKMKSNNCCMMLAPLNRCAVEGQQSKRATRIKPCSISDGYMVHDSKKRVRVNIIKK